MEETKYKEEFGIYEVSFLPRVKSMILKKIIIFFMAAIVSVAAYVIVKDYIPNFNHISMYQAVPAFRIGEIGVIIEDKAVELQYPPVLFDKEILVPVELIKMNIDDHIFWDDVQKMLIITTENKVIKMKTDDLNVYVNGKPVNLNIPVKLFSDVPYVPLNLIADFYQLRVNYVESTSVVIIDYKNKPHTTANIAVPKAYVRQAATDKSPWLVQTMKDENVNIYGSFNEWKYVRTREGYLGYVKNVELNNIQEEKIIEPTIPLVTEKWKPQGKINMLWRQVFKPENITDTSKLEKNLGVNVVSPTWFHIINAAGDMRNYADKNYVNWAHKNGMKVWALVANPFTEKEMTHLMLSNTETREKMIRQLLVYANLYNLDGINIDFESLDPKTGPYFIQFLRELSPYMNTQGLTLSVDVYAPSKYTAFYNRKEIAKVADYVCVMTYDEHWSTSPTAGSVASADWVEQGVQKTLVEVPKEKLIMGIPFYTRVWVEKDGKLEGKPKAVSMDTASKLVSDNNATVTWLPDDKQFYAEYKKDGLTYKIWLEDKTSIIEKINILKKYGLAGAAEWKAGMENAEIWNVINKELNS